jgi:hypothetical protein
LGPNERSTRLGYIDRPVMEEEQRRGAKAMVSFRNRPRSSRRRIRAVIQRRRRLVDRAVTCSKGEDDDRDVGYVRGDTPDEE